MPAVKATRIYIADRERSADTVRNYRNATIGLTASVVVISRPFLRTRRRRIRTFGTTGAIHSDADARSQSEAQNENSFR